MAYSLLQYLSKIYYFAYLFYQVLYLCRYFLDRLGFGSNLGLVEDDLDDACSTWLKLYKILVNQAQVGHEIE